MMCNRRSNKEHWSVPGWYYEKLCACMRVVRSNLYHLLGIFAAVYPEHMVKNSNKLLEVYVGVLKAEVTLVLLYRAVVFTKFIIIHFFALPSQSKSKHSSVRQILPIIHCFYRTRRINCTDSDCFFDSSCSSIFCFSLQVS